MKRYSLYTFILGLSVFLIVVSFISIYFMIIQQKKSLIGAAIKEKIRLAATINEVITSPVWSYRAVSVPDLQEVFVTEMAKFEGVRYIRIVRLDGTIAQSSTKEEWAGTIKDPDIEKAITAKKTIIKDEVFKEEKLKTIIYPGYKDQTIWIGFTLKNIEEETKMMLIRYAALALVGPIFTLLFIFLILQVVIDPLRKMIFAFEETRKGNLEVAVPVTSKTEIGELATAFNETIKALRKSQTDLEEARDVLEIKVAARTKELKELAEKQEEIIKKRTKELQKRIEELERFNRLAVGRELKMIELKESLKKCQEEIRKLKRVEKND